MSNAQTITAPVYPIVKLFVEIRTMPLAIANHGGAALPPVLAYFIRNLRKGGTPPGLN
jgi:hypothetical protein